MVSSPFMDAYHRSPKDTQADRVRRASLAAADAKFFPRPKPPQLSVSLTGFRAGAWETSSITRAIQEATAKLGHLIAEPRTEVVKARPSYRELVKLTTKQSDNTIFFFFSNSEYDAPLLDPMLEVTTESLAERAALDLCAILPRDQDDDSALQAILGRRTTERSAISGLAKAVKDIGGGLELSLRTSTQTAVNSSLSHEQADVLVDSLKESTLDRRTTTVRGMLDGMRTSRRVFFLDPESGPTIQGAIDVDLLGAVRDSIGLIVTAEIESVTPRLRSGHQRKTAYRLLSLSVDQQLIELPTRQ